MASQLPILCVGDVIYTKPNQGWWWGTQRRVVEVLTQYGENSYTFDIIKSSCTDTYTSSICSHRRYCREVADGNWRLITYPDYLALPEGV